jgi:hypothetical protein
MHHFISTCVAVGIQILTNTLSRLVFVAESTPSAVATFAIYWLGTWYFLPLSLTVFD